MSDGTCYVALLPADPAPDHFELPADSPGAGTREWGRWQSAAVAAQASDWMPQLMAGFSLMLWRWSGRDTFGFYVCLEAERGWELAAVRLSGTACWDALVRAWMAVLAGPLAWTGERPGVARAGIDFSGQELAAPEVLDWHWQTDSPSEVGRVRSRQRGAPVGEAMSELISGAWLQLAGATASELALAEVPLFLLSAQQAQWTRMSGPDLCHGQETRTITAQLALLARQDAQRLAVGGGTEGLTYGALYAAAQVLAQQILSIAGPAAEAVGIMFPPGPQMLVALYGTLLANKYYVPLDPHYPAARLQAMVDDADPVLILADGPLMARARAIAGDIPVVKPGTTAHRDSVRLSPAAPGDLAYILYTSGSTGTPKGVMQTHGNVIFHARTYGRSIGLGPADRVALMSSLCFDASVMDIFASLMHGASLYPFTPGRTDPGALLAAIDDAAITVLHATPTLFRLLFGAPGVTAPPSIRAVVLGGELVTPSDVAMFRRTFGADVTLVNGYGPSESTMALQYVVSSQRPIPAEGVPVGYPVPGACATVGAPGEPWRAFQQGELFIHTAHLFLGYLNREDESAACFVKGSDGRAYYRTGDLALRLPDGRLLVRGRIDHQIKLRGFRIEPGDIEAQLMAFAGVRQAALRLGRLNGRDALLAYVAIGPGCERIDEASLRARLRAQLPEHMQPAVIVQMGSLPLTPSGKIDRLALPSAIDEADQAGGGADSTEQRLAGLLEQLLGRRPSSDVDFFGAGGHSLAALQLVSRVRQEFQVELQLQDIFDAPSLAALAAAIERLGHGAGTGPRPDASEARRDASGLPLAAAQRGLWYLHEVSDEAAGAYNMQLALRIRGKLEVQELRSALEQLTARHDTLRTGFRLGDEGPVQEVREGLGLRFRHWDHARDATRHCDLFVGEVAQTEAAQVFDLDDPPLMRVVSGSFAPDEHYVVITLHHLIADGWSLQLLLREFSLLYRAAVERRAAPLSPLAWQYGDYAVWQQGRLGEQARARLAGFWRRYLDGAAPLLRWKVLDPAVARHAGGSYSFTVPAELKQALTQLGARHRATPFMTLLAAWSLQLAAESGRSDIVVGTAAANRPTPDSERLIGLFVNSLPLRVAVSPGLRFDDYLCLVRDAALAAFAHQEMPFDELVGMLGRGGERAANPVFQVMLTLDTFSVEELPALPGLDVRSLERIQRTSHLDLALSLRPHGAAWMATLTFARALFSDQEAARLGADLLDLMCAIVAAPAATCDELAGKAPPLLEELEW